MLDRKAIFDQRIDYLHENPIRAGFVYQPQDWLYGSGVDYYTANEHGFLEIVFWNKSAPIFRLK
ncbi:MAG: hypothetical protein EAY75_17595 [Bacteroidetes bacterium]|nr:MAG: hypothetical protein EAY75_17595 [Bacteroidota bacterium]